MTAHLNIHIKYYLARVFGIQDSGFKIQDSKKKSKKTIFQKNITDFRKVCVHNSPIINLSFLLFSGFKQKFSICGLLYFR